MTQFQTLGLLVLSLLASATWFVDYLLPVDGMSIAGEGLRLLLCSVLSFLMLAGSRRVGLNVFSLRCLQAATVSLGLVAVPFLLLSAARGRIVSTDGVLIFALTPVAIMLMTGWTGSEQDGLRSLPSALTGAAGVMILLPVRLPASGAELLGACAVVVAMLLSAGCMVWTHLLLRELSISVAIPSICLANGVVLCLAAGVPGWSRWGVTTLWPDSLRAILFELPQMVLLTWLLKTISPQRLAGRYLIAPLFTVVEGLFLVRPHFEMRTLAGLGLLAAGVGMTVFGRRTTEADGLRLTAP